jgi:hypothetical protein
MVGSSDPGIIVANQRRSWIQVPRVAGFGRALSCSATVLYARCVVPT